MPASTRTGATVVCYFEPIGTPVRIAEESESRSRSGSSDFYDAVLVSGEGPRGVVLQPVAVVAEWTIGAS